MKLFAGGRSMRNSRLFYFACLVVTGLLVSGCGLFSKKSPYDLAKEGNIEMLKRLFAEGTGVDEKYGYQERTLLFGAVEREDAKTAKFLIEQGADVNFKDQNGNTPLMHSVRYGHTAPVLLLLNNGAQVNHLNENKRSAFSRAVNNEEVELAGVLLAHGAKVDFKNDDGESGLHLATRRGNLKMVQLLLDYKVRVNAKNDEGYTALYFSDEFSYDNISTLLKKNGARLKHPAPTATYYKKTYAKLLGKGPLQVKRVIKHSGVSQRAAFSDAGDWIVQALPLDQARDEGLNSYDFPDSFSIPNREEDVQTYVLRAWNVKTGKEKFSAIPLESQPYGLGVASDGNLLVTHTQQPGIQVWDPATGKKIRMIGHEEGAILGTGRVESNQYLLVGENKRAFAGPKLGLLDSVYPAFREMTGGLEHSLWVYNYQTGDLLREYPGHMGIVEQAGFSFDGEYVAAISSRSYGSSGALRIWETATGRPVRVQRGLGWVYDMIPFPNDRRLAVINHRQTLILDMENGQVIRKIREGGGSVGLLKGGRYLAFLSYEQLVLVSVKTGRVVQKVDFRGELNKLGSGYRNAEHLSSLTASPDGESFFITTNHGKIIVFGLKRS